MIRNFDKDILDKYLGKVINFRDLKINTYNTFKYFSNRNIIFAIYGSNLKRLWNIMVNTRYQW